jgi:DNA-binding GntR family transcriptional regulator
VEKAKKLKKIPKASLLPTAVYEQLRAAILSGILRPGQFLRQEDIAGQLGVSRGPLREALPKLEAEGMIISLPHRGYSVVTLKSADIAEIFELRATLETSLAGIAAERADEQTVACLRNLDANMRDLAASAKPADRLRWFDINYEFHRTLLAPAGRRYHLWLLDLVRALAEPYIRMETNLTGNLDECQEEHRLLIDAFAARDARALPRLARLHVQHSADRLLEALQQASREVGLKERRLIA